MPDEEERRYHFDFDPATGIGAGVGGFVGKAHPSHRRMEISRETYAAIGNHPCCFKVDGEKVVRWQDEHPPKPVPVGKSQQAIVDELKDRLSRAELQIAEIHMMVRQILSRIGEVK